MYKNCLQFSQRYKLKKTLQISKTLKEYSSCLQNIKICLTFNQNIKLVISQSYRVKLTILKNPAY